MISVLHVFDRSLDAEARRTRETITRQMPVDVRCTSMPIGPGGDVRDAVAAGLRLRRNGVDVVHAWGRSALTAVAIGGARAIVYSPTQPPPAEARLLNWLHRRRTVRVVTGTACESAPFRVATAVAIRPAVQSPAVDRAAVRRSLGLAADDIALLAVGESTRAAAHPAAVWAAGILNVLDSRYKVVLWGRGPQAPAAVKLAEKMRQRDMVVTAEKAGTCEVEWESLVGAADVGLLTAAGPVATWPIAAAMAGGLPIVSTLSRSTADFVTGRTARLADDSSPRALARCVLDVRDDGAATAVRTAAARAVAAELFSVDRLLLEYADLYRNAAAGN